MIDEPEVMPVTIPEEEPIDALPLLLLQVPPPASDKVVVAATQTDNVPVIPDGSGSTVTIVVVRHPVDSPYVIIDVPEETPNTVPDVLIVATEVLPLLHVPPVAVVLREVVLPWQASAVPVMAPGRGLTVTALTAKHPAPSE
jgi:hypothetical protein